MGFLDKAKELLSQNADKVETAIDKVAVAHPDTRYEMVLADRKDSYLIERDHPLVQALGELTREPVTRRTVRWPVTISKTSTVRLRAVTRVPLSGLNHRP